MRFELDVAGRRRTVSIEPIGGANHAGGRVRVAIEDAERGTRTTEVEARATELGVSVVYADDHRSVDAAVTMRRGGDLLVQFGHADVTVLVDPRRTGASPAEPAGAGEQRLTAPMPGRVVRVLVSPGQAVAARQGLVVVEAMKMENEIAAPRAGVVKEVAVVGGASVEASALLVVIAAD
jgi:biotin carboxyl carrier protein